MTIGEIFLMTSLAAILLGGGAALGTTPQPVGPSLGGPGRMSAVNVHVGPMTSPEDRMGVVVVIVARPPGRHHVEAEFELPPRVLHADSTSAELSFEGRRGTLLLPLDILADGEGDVRVSTRVVLSDGEIRTVETRLPVRVKNGVLEADTGFHEREIVRREGQRFAVIRGWVVPLKGSESPRRVTGVSIGKYEVLDGTGACEKCAPDDSLRFAVVVNEDGEILGSAFQGAARGGTPTPHEVEELRTKLKVRSVDWREGIDVVWVTVPVRR